MLALTFVKLMAIPLLPPSSPLTLPWLRRSRLCASTSGRGRLVISLRCWKRGRSLKSLE